MDGTMMNVLRQMFAEAGKDALRGIFDEDSPGLSSKARADISEIAPLEDEKTRKLVTIGMAIGLAVATNGLRELYELMEAAEEASAQGDAK